MAVSTSARSWANRCPSGGAAARRRALALGGPPGAPAPSGRQHEQNGSMADGPDRWHRWLLDVRFGGDARCRAKDLAEFLYPVRDTVLDKAHLAPGETLLDVGTGDGLIAFGALDGLGPSGHVIFSDISQDLLDHCRAAASAEGLLGQCQFLLAPGDDLTAVTEASVDAVTTRSVLISLADPDLFSGYDVTPVRALAAKVRAIYESIQPPGVDPMIDFDDRDLVRHAQDAGFPEIDLELRVSVKARKEPVPWERLIRSSGNPLTPTFGGVLDQALSPEEAAEFTRHLRPLVETGAGLERRALAYLTAVKAPISRSDSH